MIDRIQRVSIILPLVLLSSTTKGATEGFVVSENVIEVGAAKLYRIDLDTGATELVGNLQSENGDAYAPIFGGLSFDSVDRLLGSRYVHYNPQTFEVLSPPMLVEIDPESGTVNPIGQHNAVLSIDYIDESSDYNGGDFLAGFDFFEYLGSVDTGDGGFTAFGGTVPDPELDIIHGLAYDSESDVLYGISPFSKVFSFDSQMNLKGGVWMFDDDHYLRGSFPTDDFENPWFFVGTLGADFDQEKDLIYLVAHVEGPADPDTSEREDDPATAIREDFMTNNPDSLLLTIDVSNFDGQNANTLKTTIIGDTGLSWLGGLAIRNTVTKSCDFDGDGTLGVGDLDLLLAEVRAESNKANFDITGDGIVTTEDVVALAESPDKLNTYIGDADLDGEFNSSDLVVVFQGGEYEDAIAFNSTWSTGDWNGDGDFGTGDLVLAFVSGGFEQGPRDPVGAVPEPSALILLCYSAFGVWGSRRRILRAVQ